VDQAAFSIALASWHDFFLAAGSASAALLGLLFVGVSINIASLSPDTRPEFRVWANIGFSNLLYVVGLSLIMLIPGAHPETIAISFVVVGVLGIARIATRTVDLYRARSGWTRRRDMVRRIAWTIAADVLLLAIAATLVTSDDTQVLLATPIVVFVLMLGAADVAWDLLVWETRPPRAP